MRSKALKCFERGSAMSFPRLIFAFALSITATGSIAQTIPFKTALSDAVVAAIPPSTTEDFYTKLRDERRRNAPRIVFVPGILGSKIEECQSDGTQCKEIWGTVKAVISKDIDLSIRPDRVYRTDVVDDLFFNDIYGVSLSYLRSRASQASPDSADDPLVTVFPYDWRQSNARNAISLANKICQVRLKAPESPIVLIAHSMGGLMAKIWANRYSRADCSNGAKPSVSRFVFVATPHLGAPKTIKAIAQGYNILFDELDRLNRYKSWFARFERDYFLDSLNQAGMSFASLYELLPIRTSEYCRNAKPTLAKTLNPVDGEDGKPLNLFDPNAWRHYDLLRRIGAPAIRDVYYDNKLAPLLRNAEVLLCEIVDFDPSSVADVIYLFGREKTDRTYGWFHLRLGMSDNIDKFTNTQGDGTVPVYSAQNFLISRTNQTREVEADHVSIIHSPVLFGLIDEWYEEAAAKSKIKIGQISPDFSSLLVAEAAASGTLIPVSLNARNWSNKDNRFAININSQALTMMGYSLSELSQYAALHRDPLERAKLFAVAASSSDSPSQRLGWTAEVAKYAYISSHFDDSIQTAGLIVDAKRSNAGGGEVILASNDPNIATVDKQAKEIIGWAYLRSGNIDRFNSSAEAYAREYAVARNEFKEPTMPSRDGVWVLYDANSRTWAARNNAPSVYWGDEAIFPPRRNSRE